MKGKAENPPPALTAAEAQLLVAFALAYASEMNALERDVYAQAQANPDQDVFPDYERRYAALFRRYATSRRRVYGGRATSYGTPAQYDGIEDARVRTATLNTRSRAEVYFQTTNQFQAEYLFVLLRQYGEWRIDSYKQRRYGSTEWRPQLL